MEESELIQEGNLIKNKEGEVAVRYIKPVPRSATVQGKAYTFSLNHDITLSWIAAEDANNFFAFREGCCGTTPKNVFVPATLRDVIKFYNG